MTRMSRAQPGRGEGRCGGRRRGAAGGARGAELIALLLAALLSGCQLFGQDSGRCDQSVATVRQAIGFKDFASARTWREYTWKVCDDEALLATLDKELVDAESAAAAEVGAAQRQAKKLAKERINTAQKLWRAFDAEPASAKNQQSLAATRESAMRLEGGLDPAYAQQLRKYNEGEYQKRLAALKR